MNNSSMFTADRMTHLKIVVVALVCATRGRRHRHRGARDRRHHGPGRPASHRDQGDSAGHRGHDRRQYGSLIAFSVSNPRFTGRSQGNWGRPYSFMPTAGARSLECRRTRASLGRASGGGGGGGGAGQVEDRVGPQLCRQALGEEPPGADQARQHAPRPGPWSGRGGHPAPAALGDAGISVTSRRAAGAHRRRRHEPARTAPAPAPADRPRAAVRPAPHRPPAAPRSACAPPPLAKVPRALRA